MLWQRTADGRGVKRGPVSTGQFQGLRPLENKGLGFKGSVPLKTPQQPRYKTRTHRRSDTSASEPQPAACGRLANSVRWYVVAGTGSGRAVQPRTFHALRAGRWLGCRRHIVARRCDGAHRRRNGQVT